MLGSTAALLEVRNLHVRFRTSRGIVRAIEDISFDVADGELVALVGESGSGKTVTALSIMRLLPANLSFMLGSILFNGRDLLELSGKEMNQIRGNEIAIIFQDSLSALNPIKTIGHQIRESILLHQNVDKPEAEAITLDLLDQVGLPDPATQVYQYPHQLSGGMNQRAMIAMALACEPQLLIADEPTTAVDATTQAQIMALIVNLARQRGMAVILITHDLGLVAGFAERVLIMYAGHLVEEGTTETIFYNTKHPYTRGLLAARPGDQTDARTIPGSVPDLIKPPPGCVFHPRCCFSVGREDCHSTVPPLEPYPELSRSHRVACHIALELDNLMHEHRVGARQPSASLVDGDNQTSESGGLEILRLEQAVKKFKVSKGLFGQRGVIRAVDGVSFSLHAGETFALVGESGSGKSTTLRLIMCIESLSSGRILFRNVNLASVSSQQLRNIRRKIGVVFQDPDSSLDPRMSIGDIVAEPLLIHRMGNQGERMEEAHTLLDRVGIDPLRASQRPSELSGGQRQRVAIARALATRPSVILCDEPVTMLDASVQAQILDLLRDIQAETGVAYLLVAHDLGMVRQMADRVAVMYLGKVVEFGSTQELFENAHHPYSVSLLSAMPISDPHRERQRNQIILSGTRANPLSLPTGCRFAPVCWKAQDLCHEIEPTLVKQSPGHWAACHFPEGHVTEPTCLT